MANFLLQTIDGKIKHDFVFEMEHAIEYNKWRYIDTDAEYASLEDMQKGINKDKYKNYIPIGTIEFVYTFIDNYILENGSKKIKPLNVPEELFKYAGRKIQNIEIIDNHNIDLCDWNDSLYIKDNDIIKSDRNGLAYKHDIEHINPGNYQISERINILSEYRCFIYEGELVGIQYYSGDFTIFPDVDIINKMIKDYKKCPRVWTLDVAITDKTETIVIECHEFYSCGLYGFSDYNRLPFMFIRAFNDLKCAICSE